MKRLDIWNPWHGCKKYSEGCKNCYMYYLDKIHGNNGAYIYKVKNNFYYPLSKNRQGEYKIKSGEQIRVCMTSDFFLEEADLWREEAWRIIKARSDVIFILISKRIERVADCLPKNWGLGWENVILYATCETQRRADERLPILLELPFKHKGIMCAPLLEAIHLEKYLQSGQVEQIICGGENYNGARVCDFSWVQSLYAQAVNHNINFCFMETGTVFRKDAKYYHMPDKRLQSEMALKSGLNFIGKNITYKLCDQFGRQIAKDSLYEPYFKEKCKLCASKYICNGCNDCGNCK